jgi:hypothetical protein
MSYPAFRQLHAETLKPSKLEPREIRLMAWFSAVVVSVLAYDLYYYYYLYEPAIPALTPTDFKEFPLKEIIPITHDTSLFRFSAAIQDPKSQGKSVKPMISLLSSLKCIFLVG